MLWDVRQDACDIWSEPRRVNIRDQAICPHFLALSVPPSRPPAQMLQGQRQARPRQQPTLRDAARHRSAVLGVEERGGHLG